MTKADFVAVMVAEKPTEGPQEPSGAHSEVRGDPRWTVGQEPVPGATCEFPYTTPVMPLPKGLSFCAECAALKPEHSHEVT